MEELGKPALEEKSALWKIELDEFADLCRKYGFDGIYLNLNNIIDLKDAIAILLRVCDFFDGFAEAVNWYSNDERLGKIKDIHIKANELLHSLKITKRQRLSLFQ